MRLHDSTAAQAAAHGRQSNLSGARQTLMAAVWSALGQSGFKGNVSDLAEALRSALSAGLSAGQNLAPALATAINTALDSTAQALTSRGVDSARVAQLISGFRRDLSRAIDALPVQVASSGAGTTSGQTGSSGGVSQVSGTATVSASQSSTGAQSTTGTPTVSSASTAAGYLSRESESLQITTADGDRVTIRFRQQDIVAVAGAAPAADGASGSQAAAISSGRLQISVRGSLSSDELKAIDDLVSQVDALATQFFSGNLQDAFNSAAALGADPSQIAQFSLHLSYAQIGTGPFAAAVAAPVPTNTIPPPATTTSTPATAPSVGASAATAATDAAASGPENTSTAQAGAPEASGGAQPGSGSPGTTTQPSAGVSSGSAQQTIGSFIQDVLGKLGSVDGTSGMRFSMKWKLELLAAVLPAYAPTVPSAAARATQLASSTLRSLAG